MPGRAYAASTSGGAGNSSGLISKIRTTTTTRRPPRPARPVAGAPGPADSQVPVAFPTRNQVPGDGLLKHGEVTGGDVVDGLQHPHRAATRDPTSVPMGSFGLSSAVTYGAINSISAAAAASSVAGTISLRALAAAAGSAIAAFSPRSRPVLKRRTRSGLDSTSSRVVTCTAP